MSDGLNCRYLNRYNSTADCSISLTFGAEFDHVIPYKRSKLRVKGQGHSAT